MVRYEVCMFDFLTTDVDRYLVCMFARHGSEHEVSCTGSRQGVDGGGVFLGINLCIVVVHY